MSRAEERACQYTGYCKNQSYSDFLNGYKQAEKDNELTWEDIDWIVGEAVCRVSEDSEVEQICKEVLKHFKDYKERREK